MKKTFKRFLACFAALAILCSMVTVFADPANTVDIEKVEVLNEGAVIAASYEGDLSIQNITLTQEQLLKVTISLKNSEDVALKEGDITFLSYTNGTDTSGLSNDNIQYIDQGSVATAENNKVVVTFRPRATLEPNTFVAKAGGTDAEVDSFTYTVTAAKTALSLTVGNGSIQEDDATGSITFTMGGMTGENPDYSTVTVSSVAGDTVTALTSGSDYTIDGTTLTILNAHTKAVGTYSIKISHADYKDSNVVSYEVTAAPIVIPPEDQDAVEEELGNVEIDASVADDAVVGETTEITLPEKVGTTDYSYEYSISSNGTAITDNNVVKIENGKLKYTPTAESRFAEKVVIDVTVGDMAPVTKTVYLIHPDKGIAFGNITAIDSEGADIFAANATFTAAMADPAISAEVEMARAEALNIGLGKNDGSNVAAVKKTLDFDGNGTVTLAEYRIYKLMLAGDDKYLPETLKEVREQYSENF